MRHTSHSFLKFAYNMIERKKELGKISIAKNYLAAVNSFRRYSGGTDIKFTQLTPSCLEEYEVWLTQTGIKTNSISFYFRNLRALYNSAVDTGATIDRHPFKKRYTKIEKTSKRAISMADIKRIKHLDLSQDIHLDLARDVFLFLFYCRGMSFIDAAFLSAANIRNGKLVYRRHKTGQELRIGLNDHISGIISKWENLSRIFNHPPTVTPYLLPILNATGSRSKWELRTRYESALRHTNKALKIIARMAHINIPLSTYVSRHSWATIAKTKGIPTATISDALGHDSEMTTQIYLDSLSPDTIDRANALILCDL